VFTGKVRKEVIIKALDPGADRYINKIGDPETVYIELKHTIVELTEQTRTEERLREKENQYRTLIENTPDVLTGEKTIESTELRRENKKE
jgi:PAS domain-containing protein